VLVHLDTDFGGNVDDACALALLLGWPDVDLVGVTTVGDPDGRRAGYVRRFLTLAGRGDVPVAQGAAASLTDGRRMGELLDHDRYWGGAVPVLRSAAGAALDLLARNVSRGATVAAIGPATNLAMLSVARPDVLENANVVMMGGWLGPLGEGLPSWGPERDTNVQRDIRAMTALFRTSARLTLVPLATTMRFQLRSMHLSRLARAGMIGDLLARQALVYAQDAAMPDVARRWPGLHQDLVSFQHDPVTCAVAVGWPGVDCRERRLSAVVEDGVLRFRASGDGRPVRVAAGEAFEGAAEAFSEAWIETVERAG
jgi:purine nucleosidase